ncbi:MAG: ABC transporter substrate-binding protein, partial [Candidatus Bathyanammoxibius sp.]
MTRKPMGLIFGCLVVAALVLASCSSDTTTDTTTDTPGATDGEPGAGMVTDSIGRLVEEPQYGGTLTFVFGELTWHPLGGDSPPSNDFIFEGMLFWDFTRGPSGTGELPMNGAGGGGTLEDYVGGLIESWEQPIEEEITLHVRQGVRWQDSPLLNGREVVADDIVYSVNEMMAYSNSLLYTAPGDPGWVATALDKYTVHVVMEAPKLRTFGGLAAYTMIIPSEVEAEELNWNSWKSSVGTGTGPYILEDVVEGSSYTLARNPNYYRSDPLHPENKLPYPDYVRGLTIDDVSTQIAALRTGQIDYLGVGFAQGPNLIRTNPELVYKGQPSFDDH